jgi:hypothetical protein
MKCPHCHGRGTRTRRFWIITWQRPCSHCGGTGTAGAPRLKNPWSDDDFRSRTDDSFPSSTVSARDRDEAFVVGDGGRSGGAGGGASWGDPVIVDPFAAETTSASGATSAEADSSADSGGTSSDGGTAY